MTKSSASYTISHLEVALGINYRGKIMVAIKEKIDSFKNSDYTLTSIRRDSSEYIYRCRWQLQAILHDYAAAKANTDKQYFLHLFFLELEQHKNTFYKGSDNDSKIEIKISEKDASQLIVNIDFDDVSAEKNNGRLMNKLNYALPLLQVLSQCQKSIDALKLIEITSPLYVLFQNLIFQKQKVIDTTKEMIFEILKDKSCDLSTTKKTFDLFLPHIKIITDGKFPQDKEKLSQQNKRFEKKIDEICGAKSKKAAQATKEKISVLCCALGFAMCLMGAVTAGVGFILLIAFGAYPMLAMTGLFVLIGTTVGSSIVAALPPPPHPGVSSLRCKKNDTEDARLKEDTVQKVVAARTRITTYSTFFNEERKKQQENTQAFFGGQQLAYYKI